MVELEIKDNPTQVSDQMGHPVVKKAPCKTRWEYRNYMDYTCYYVSPNHVGLAVPDVATAQDKCRLLGSVLYEPRTRHGMTRALRFAHFQQLSVVYPKSYHQHDIGCTDDQLLKLCKTEGSRHDHDPGGGDECW